MLPDLTSPLEVAQAVLRFEDLTGRIQTDPQDPSWVEVLVQWRGLASVLRELLPHAHPDQVLRALEAFRDLPEAHRPEEDGSIATVDAWVDHFPPPTPQNNQALLALVPGFLAQESRMRARPPRLRLAHELLNRVVGDTSTREARLALVQQDLSGSGKRTPLRRLVLKLAHDFSSKDLLDLVPQFLEGEGLESGELHWLARHLTADHRGEAVLLALEAEQVKVAVRWFQEGPVPLPIAALRARRATEPDPAPDFSGCVLLSPLAYFDTKLQCNLEDLPSDLAQAVLDASQETAPFLGHSLRRMLTRDAKTGQSGWQAWLLAGAPEGETLKLRANPIRAVRHAVLASLTEDITSGAPLVETLKALRAQPYSLSLREALPRLMKAVLFDNLPQSIHYGDRAEYDADRRRDQRRRTLLLDQVLPHLDLVQLPGLVGGLLETQLDDHPGDFDSRFAQLRPYLDPSHQTLEHALLGKVLESLAAGWLQDLALSAPLWEITPPEVIGGLLLIELSHGRTLGPELGPHPERSPLPVALVRAHLAEGKRLAQFDAGLEQALDHPGYSPFLRQRLHEACREVRPHISEARYQAEDRLKGLQGRSATGTDRPRRRV